MAQTILMAATRNKLVSASMYIGGNYTATIGLYTSTGEPVLEWAELCRVVGGVVQAGVYFRDPRPLPNDGEYVVRKGKTSAPIGVFCEA